MISLKIIALGKLKEIYWKNAESEYLKRLSPYAKIKIIELKEEAFISKNEREKVQKKEAKKILKKLLPDEIVIAFHEQGKELISTDLAKFLEQKSQQGLQLTFVIGGPLGLHSSVLEKAKLQLSLSRLTFSHQLARTILLEQLYRCVMIGKGKYHY